MERSNIPAYSVNYQLAVLDVEQKCKQMKSGTYVACEQMIRMSFMNMRLAALDQMLDRFEKTNRLTHAEHQNLLRLALHLWHTDH